MMEILKQLSPGEWVTIVANAAVIAFFAGGTLWRMRSLEKTVLNGISTKLCKMADDVDAHSRELAAIDERCQAHAREIDRIDQRVKEGKR